MAANSMQENLDRLLGELRSNERERCLSALQELAALHYSSPAILKELEQLALKGMDRDVRSLANELIRNSVHQNVRARLNTLNKYNRLLFLQHIDQWQADGLLEADAAEVIKQRYNFDTDKLPASPARDTEKETPPPPAVQQPAVPAGPRPTLMQTLLSESSIKIYLYLGAFFVIASALILAALVETARLPILGVATLVFGGGALLLHRRLPQPSFALFIVFSFLLPIDAAVLEDTLGLAGPVLSIYWAIVFLVLAGIWTFSLWFYKSRLFSAVAFLSLCLAFYQFGEIFDTEVELQILLGILVALIGLAWTFVLKKWMGLQFSLFVYLLAHLLTVSLLIISFSLSVYHLIDSEIPSVWWLVTAVTWLAAASFYALSNILTPLFLLPWMAAGALLPLPWFVLQGFEASQSAYAIGFWVWGTAFALASEAVLEPAFEKAKKYHWPLLAGSVPLYFVSFIIAFFEDENPTLPFAIGALSALIYTGLHWVRPRWYVWGAALLSALFAYFLFFNLPALGNLEVSEIDQFLIASVLLLVPELFTRTPLTWQAQTRVTTLIFGILLSLPALTALGDFGQTGRAALVLSVYTILLSLHALHAKRAWIGYFAAAFGSLAVVYALDHIDLWLPALTALSLGFYGSGFLIRRPEATNAWGEMLINSGLVLGALVSLTAPVIPQENSGWYILLIALVFAVEMFNRPLPWLEIAVETLLFLALYLVLDDFNITIGHFLFGAAIIWLGGDLIFGLTIRQQRPGRLITIAVGYILVLLSTVALWGDPDQIVPAIYFFLYTLFFACSAILQREPRLGYLATAFLPLAAIKVCDVVNFDQWSFPLIGISILYYASGFWLRRKGRSGGWGGMLLYSGLGLGVLTSFLALREGGLDAPIPVAIAATLFAAEAFARRNVWLALPANLLYLMSYFMFLLELNVDEPQYYSIGAALLGMLIQYLLTRAGSQTGAFIAGILSQLVLLGTTYIQMVSTGKISFFFVLFIQSIVVLIYGLVLRSRSLVITPIAFAVIGVMTVIYSALKGLGPVILIGSTGLVLLLAGIAAVLMRERISKLGEQLSDWKP